MLSIRSTASCYAKHRWIKKREPKGDKGEELKEQKWIGGREGEARDLRRQPCHHIHQRAAILLSSPSRPLSADAAAGRWAVGRTLKDADRQAGRQEVKPTDRGRDKSREARLTKNSAGGKNQCGRINNSQSARRIRRPAGESKRLAAVLARPPSPCLYILSHVQ